MQERSGPIFTDLFFYLCFWACKSEPITKTNVLSFPKSLAKSTSGEKCLFWM